MRTEILNTQVYPIVEIKGVQIQLDLDIYYSSKKIIYLT